MLLDVYVRVSILEYTQQTHTVEASLSPCWDETLIFPDMRIFGPPSVHMISEPVSLLVQLYDGDESVSESISAESNHSYGLGSYFTTRIRNQPLMTPFSSHMVMCASEL